MASLRRATYVYYTHPQTGKRCPPSTPGAVRHQGRSAVWRGRYVDEHGNHVEANLSENKDTARRMLAELVRSAELARVGLGDPYARHRRRPLEEHVAEYAAALEATGTRKNASKVAYRLREVFGAAKATLLEHVTGSAVTAAIAALRASRDARPAIPDRPAFSPAEAAAALGVHPDTVCRVARRVGAKGSGAGRRRTYTRAEVLLMQGAQPGMGVATANHYLAACKAFCRWLAQDRRLASSPLEHLRRQNAAADVRRERRALSEEEFGRFVAAAAAGPTLRGLTGPQRLVLYTCAAFTGFRAQELASLTPGSFDWGALTVTVEAAASKHRRRDVQVLRADVADLLRRYAAGIPAGGRLWPGAWWKDGADLVRADLAAAGIPYRLGGRVFDFHGLRSLMPSWLAAAGVHPRVVQELARHSDVRLTMRHYTQLNLLDVRGALENLPGAPGGAAGEEKGTA